MEGSSVLPVSSNMVLYIGAIGIEGPGPRRVVSSDACVPLFLAGASFLVVSGALGVETGWCRRVPPSGRPCES